MADRTCALIYFGDWHIFSKMLSAEQIGELMLAAMRYAETGDETEVSASVAMAYEFMKQKIDRDAKQYDKTCKQRSAAARSRWTGNDANTEQNDDSDASHGDDASACESMQVHASACDESKSMQTMLTTTATTTTTTTADAVDRRARTREGTSAAATAPDVDPNLGEVYSAYQKCGIGTYSVHDRERVADLYAEYGKVWCVEAFSRAADAGKRTIAYAEGIMRSWKAGGGMDERGSGRSRAAPDNPALNYTQRRDDLEGMYVDL